MSSRGASLFLHVGSVDHTWSVIHMDQVPIHGLVAKFNCHVMHVFLSLANLAIQANLNHSSAKEGNDNSLLVLFFLWAQPQSMDTFWIKM